MSTRLPPSPHPSSDATRRSMQGNRGRDTKVELALRRALHSRGLRYRVHRRPVAGLRCESDILFQAAKVAVFVDGCWWHGCPEHWSAPKNNREWWTRKISLNVERDRRNDQMLSAAGWCVLRIWEHQNVEEAAAQVEAVVRGERTDRSLRRA
jgi:DNA mismatch endonuclease, patch repair protein